MFTLKASFSKKCVVPLLNGFDSYLGPESIITK